ncbi:MAG TPA: PH domain-containing protein [Solirubrobacteraceae bacterium]|nr:PH domain-containing protein [Solirubrobacteraceae bacterium]
MTQDPRPAPTQPLPREVRTMWIAEAAIAALVGVVVAFVIAAWIEALMPWLPLAAAIGELAWVLVVPRRRHERWRWELDEEELDILEGVWSVTRTIVPLTRIQHVSVQRTGWTGLFGVVRLNVHTAADTTTIPGLEPARADDVRDRILARLQTPDDL